MNKIFFTLTCLLSIISAHAQKDIPVGKVIDTVYCTTNPEQSYALYVPSYYTRAEKWPVIFVFEPAARGVLPVMKFQMAAEELGYIVIASNNSKNGSWEVSFEAAEAIFSEGAAKFNIDSSRIYTSGFSGGSRVAVTLAVLNDEIAGVIGCGAGLSSVERYQPAKNDRFVYVGLVGNRDMNYQEHLLLEEKFNTLGILNHRIVFDAGHQWPAPDYLREALYWLDLQSVKKGNVVSGVFNENSLFQRMKFRADSLVKKERLVHAFQVYNHMAAVFEGTSFSTTILEEVENMSDMKQLKKDLKKDSRINGRERKYQTKIDEAFFEIRRTRLSNSIDSAAKTKEWWFGEIDSLNSVTKSKSIDKSHSAFRLLNLIWAKFATSSFNYAGLEDYQMATLLNEVWVYAQPESVWALWSMAKVLALGGDVDGSIDYLYKAHEAGMQYKVSVKNPEFDPLRDHKRFIELVSKLSVRQ